MRTCSLTLAVIAASAVAFLLTEKPAHAQMYLNRVQPPQARTGYSAPRPRYPATFYQRTPTAKPFKDVQRRPTVSPYLNLVRDDVDAAANYQTLVRPQIEQMEFNRQQEVQLQRLDRQFQQFRQESAYPIGGSQDIRPTGHVTQFMNRSHYYPQ